MIYHRWLVCFIRDGVQNKSMFNESNDGKCYGFKSREAARITARELNNSIILYYKYYVFDTLKNCKEQ